MGFGMKAGSVGIIESGTNRLDSFVETIEVEGHNINTLTQCIEITEDIPLSDGRRAQFGRAAIEDISEEESSEISEDGKVRTYKSNNKVVKTTELLFVPGSFAAVGSSSGKFAFPLISEYTNNDVSGAEIDIESLIEEYPEANPWKVGFSEHIGNAKNGTIHGEQLLTESELSDILMSSPKNQIGLEHTVNGTLIKDFITESGYVEVYQPTDISTKEFVEFIEEELLPHTYIP